MGVLASLPFEPRIEFLGRNPDRRRGAETVPVSEAQLTLSGMEGDAHAGAERSACVRMRGVYPKGAEIRNARQLTLLSAEELEEIAAAMGMGAPLQPEWLGGNIVLSGVPGLTLIPPGTRIVFESGAGLVVDLENEPCSIVARIIEKHRPGESRGFKRHAASKRGVTAWVEREGRVAPGMRCRLFIPPQRIWPKEETVL